MKKIVMVGDGGWPTGFERVVRAIGTQLQASGRYEVVQRALGYHPEQPMDVPSYPYEIKSAGQTPADAMGVTQVATWLREDQPDLMLFVQDLWNIWDYLHHVPRDMPTIGYFPTDTPNVKWSYAMAAAALTDAVPYTQFGAHETALGVRDAATILLNGYLGQGASLMDEATHLTLPRKGSELHARVDRLAACQNPAALVPIPHGIEPEKFYPVPKAEARQAWGLPEDAFVVLSVNTNQFRKRQDIAIRAFAKVRDRIPNAYLVLHCMGGDANGWDLSQLARLYGVADRVICTHWAMPTITDEQLLLLYNTADVHINTGGGEGWGLSSVESALCGVAQCVPDWSATRELWTGAGVLLPVADYRFEAKQANAAHAIVSAQQTADRLIYLAEHPESLRGVADLCQARARTFPTWAEVGQRFVERVDNALVAPAPKVLSLQAILDARQGVLTSELLTRM